MYNLRYHIASLVSVFLALAIGLVLGGLAVGGGLIDRQQVALIEGLQGEFAKLREENRALTSENKLLGSFSNDVVTAWASGRLAGHTVVAVTRPGLDQPLERVRSAAEAAGASVAVVTIREPALGIGASDSGSAAASLAPDPSSPEASLAEALTVEWRAAETARPLTASLVEAGLLEIEGMPAAPTGVSLVMLAGDEGEADPVGVALMRSFSLTGPCVGAESLAMPTGVAAAASNAGAAAMDTLGTSVGDYTLVSLLGGSSKGYYGTALGAEDAYPAISLR